MKEKTELKSKSFIRADCIASALWSRLSLYSETGRPTYALITAISIATLCLMCLVSRQGHYHENSRVPYEQKLIEAPKNHALFYSDLTRNLFNELS